MADRLRQGGLDVMGFPMAFNFVNYFDCFVNYSDYRQNN